MPASMPYNLSRVAQTVRQLQPRSILDIGCGFGKYGVIFREYLDIIPGRYNKEQWTTHIDAVEIFEPYLTPMHEYVYDNVYKMDIRDFRWDQHYDLAFMGDVLEHFPRADGLKLFDDMDCDNVLISTPTTTAKTKDLYMGNDHEEHKYIWSALEFRELDGWIDVEIGMDRYMMTVLLKRGE